MDQAKRDCIFTAAAAIFGRFGFKKASIDDIAKEAGVAKGTVYLAAESKKDLFYEVLLRDLRDWNAHLSRSIDPRMPADQLLVACARAGIASLNQRPLVKGLLLGEMDHLIPELRDRFGELRAVGITYISEILRLGIRQGTFRAALDVEEVASVLLDLQTSTILFHVRDGDTGEEERLLKRGAASFDLILNGLYPRDVGGAAGPSTT